ncbi:MAG: asparagine synthase (glutamine-hydrolyzing) [Chthoniobacteraceae bacterium]
MCGIAGIVDRSEPDPGGALGRMLARIVHRGPDGEGTHVSNADGLAIGMRRLSIIDLEGGTQPIWNEDHTVAVVFNGEIYNYVELRAELAAKGHRFRTHSDTEVLVHLYEEAGSDMTKRLRGMFAFCIMDTRRRTLMIARDHFGQKPLYWTTGNGRFAFASELKCLLTLPWVNRELRPDAFLAYVAWLSLPTSRGCSPTHFAEIRKLQPGALLHVTLDTPDDAVAISDWHYKLTDEPDLTNADEAADALDAVLKDSVGVHLRADVPVGVLLSSGLDSRVVSAYAQEWQDGRMQTFTVGFGAGDSEQSGAAATAKEIGSRHHELELSAKDLADNIARIAWHLDEPIGDPAAFAVLKVCEFARGHVKVLLSGEGSDELFGGYDHRYAGMLTTMERTQRLRRWSWLLPRGFFASKSRWKRMKWRAHSFPAAEIATLRMEGFPGDVTNPRGLTPAQLAELHGAMGILGTDVFRPQRDRLSELLCFDIRWQLAESLLQKADKMSMGASIELRTPILDMEVAKIAARIPSSLKLPSGGPGKFILRKVLARKLKEPMNRPKLGFPVPLAKWFAGPLHDQVRDELFAKDSAVCEQLDRKLLASAWEDTVAGRWDGGRTFYSLWLYEVWRRTILK